MDIDLSQYMGMYVDGSRENLDLMDKFLLALEQDPSNLEAVGEIFRAAHTLKGMSATMGFEKVAHLTHEMESILDQLRNRQIEVSPPIIDVVFETFDVLRTLVNDSIEATDSNVDIEVIVKKLQDAAKGKSVASKVEAKAVTAEEKPALAEVKAAAPQNSDESQLALELADISMNEFEQQLLIEAHQRGSHILLMVVTLVADCMLKAPRAFMVARSLEELKCEIIKSVPETKDIEEEKFDLSFKMVLLGEADDEAVKYSIESISEIESVKITRLKPEDFELQAGAGAAAPPTPAPEPPKPAPPPKAAPAAPAPQPAPAAPKQAPAPAPAPRQAAPPPPPPPAPPPPPPPPKPPAPPAGGPPKPGDKKNASAAADKRGSQTVRVDMKRLDDLMNLVGELVINRTRLEDIGAAHKLKDLNEALSRVSQISASLQSVVMQVRMVPIEQVFDRFPRMVRDLAKKLNKKINLVLEGKETEMDRTVIDEIGDPMVHLIRNAIDHGIEMPDDRIAKGKSDVGTITLIARHEGNNVLIEVIDDGKGVYPTGISRRAV
jgi:two-component system chemotaxis sensor kinase CheA